MADSTPRWTITGQVEDTRLGPSGTFTRGVVVTFSTPAGSIGSVFVPADQFSAARVRELVGARAEQVIAVEQLTG